MQSWLCQAVNAKLAVPGVCAGGVDVEDLPVDGDEGGTPAKSLQIEVSHLGVA